MPLYVPQVRSEFRKILMYMGFEEMPTNRWVESSFWNFDSLFQPQVLAHRSAMLRGRKMLWFCKTPLLFVL